MSYDALPSTDVEKWDKDFKKLVDKLAAENDEGKKERLELRKQAVALRTRDRLNQDIRTTRQYFEQHRQKVSGWLADSQQELKQARALAADYRKHPLKTELYPQLQRSVKLLADLEQKVTDDALEFGRAWVDYRGEPLLHIPETYRSGFYTVRSGIMGDQKSITVTQQQMAAATHEARALVLVADKAKMKLAIKSGGAQRPLADAQQAARNLATQMGAMLDKLTNPLGEQPVSQMSGVATGMDRDANAKNYRPTRSDFNVAQSRQQRVAATYKVIVSKAANMDKVLATTKRSFRTNELSDATVKAQLAAAAQRVAAAKAEVKLRQADAKKVQKAFAKITAIYDKHK